MGSLGSDFLKKKAMWLYPKVLGSNPPERWGHSACFSQGFVYVFGGCCGGLHFSDVLVLNLETMTWNTLSTTGHRPGPRDSHSAVLVGNRMIVFGGTNGSKKVNDLHVLDLVSKEWAQPEFRGNAPSPRESHTATLVSNDKLVIFGGSGEGEANYLNDLHVLDLTTMRWTSPDVKNDLPTPRDSHSAVAVGNKLFVYGGDCGDRYHGEVDVFDMDTFSWSKFAVQGLSPGVRAGHAAVNIGRNVYVIGGVGDRQYYNDVWVLDVSNCSWTYLDVCGQKPQGRFSHAAVVTDSDIVIYGGCGEDERPLNEMLVLQLGTDHPNIRYNISMNKLLANHLNHEKKGFLRGPENNNAMQKTMYWAKNGGVRNGNREPELELEPKQSFQFGSGILHPKRRKTSNSGGWETESEQEEHSLSLSQHSSPSQSDQDQIASCKATESISGPPGFHLFKKMKSISGDNITPSSNQKEHRSHLKQEQYHHPMVHMGRRQGSHCTGPEQKPTETGIINTMIGADVRGKVDGTFDSGFLMTATVNGKIFRGVLFSPGPAMFPRGGMLPRSLTPGSHVGITQQVSVTNQMEALNPMGVEACQSYRHGPPPMIRAAPVIRAAKEAKMRNDLQGVVLTLGGPGTGTGKI